ncbi:MAG: BrnT family toxin [Candidatus Shapirobacteria bacterium]|nr:BrnT family toxin [Candidatus Shapirobacteria bacterium]
MINFEKIDGFDWDGGNIDKNLIKHNVTCQEAEEIFLDTESFNYDDKKHSVSEERLIKIGRSFSGRILVAYYTVRKNKIRIISVRDVDKKEKNLYLHSIYI